MIEKLKYENIKFQFGFNDIEYINFENEELIEYRDVYENLYNIISSKNDYNAYISGTFNNEAIINISNYIKKNVSKQSVYDLVAYKDIEGVKKSLRVSAEHGIILKNCMEELIHSYVSALVNFYSNIEEYLNNLKEICKSSLKPLGEIEEKRKTLIKDQCFKFICDEVDVVIQKNTKYLSKYELQFYNQCNNSIIAYVIKGINSGITNYEDIIVNVLNMFKMNILVENKKDCVPIIYEKDPRYISLFGKVYDDIYVGSILRANGGVLIIPIRELLKDAAAYNELKRVIKYGKISFSREESLFTLMNDAKNNYEDIPINIKIILIGEYKYYHSLYQNDEEFREIFKILLESNNIITISEDTRDIIIENILRISKINDGKALSNKALLELLKILSRDSGDRGKIVFDREKIKDIMVMSSLIAGANNRKIVDIEDIHKYYYRKINLEKMVCNGFKNDTILINFSENRVGEINGLSVIDLGYAKFGRPIRITCTCCKGKGNIVDVQKENNLSGKIHNKSLGILRGVLYTLIGGYNNIPVDFNVSFEQLYGIVEGDSASVAETLVIISSLLKKPLKQNIGVTGSINQLGEIQCVGGINEKIEGFYNVCKIKGMNSGCGVLIPKINVDNIILNNELEEAILKDEFSIYVMEHINDAIDFMIDNNGDALRGVSFNDEIKRELKKYNGQKL